MRVTSKPGSAGRRDPAPYAPRRLLEELEQQLAEDNVRPLRRTRPRTVSRTASPPAAFDAQPDYAKYESMNAMSEPQALVLRMERRGTWFGLTARLVAAIGVSAIIAQVFVIMMPAPQQPDGMRFAAAVQPFTTAFSQQHQGEDAPKPAAARLRSRVASADTAAAPGRAQPEKEADKVLQQFLQWRRKANPNEAAP
jgi:hypothetical protein